MLGRKYCALVFLLLVSLFLCSCNQRHHLVTKGFYYWKTIYKPTSFEVNTLHEMRAQKMYLRLFDVDWDMKAMQTVPVAPIQLPAHVDTSIDYVPVVFITQNVLAQMQEKDAGKLAAQINGFVKSLSDASGIHPSELQIDCDWTATTKTVYFLLLKELKAQPFFKGKTLSCTIRLHQVKYFVSSGIPPVDKGMLMCYSMGDLKKYGNLNSILNVVEADKYLANIDKYPLPLDIALPLFQWCVLFHEQQFSGILHDISPVMVINNSLFKQKQGDLYACTRDTVWNGYSLTANDVIRVESVPFNDLVDIAWFTSKRLKEQELNVVFFSCDSITLSKYSTNELETVYNTFR